MGWLCARQGRVPGWGQARVGCRSSLRRGRGAMMGFAVSTGRRGQSEGRPRQVLGVMTCTTRADQGKAVGGVHATLGRCSRART
jgi:hypothetical protein